MTKTDLQLKLEAEAPPTPAPIGDKKILAAARFVQTNPSDHERTDPSQ